MDDELPSKTKIVPWLKISKQQYDKRRERMQIQPMTRTTKPQYASHKNPLNNIVIFVSFKDATTFSKKRSVYDSRFNSTTSSSGSLKDYYKEVSYSNLDITSHFYPKTSDMTSTAKVTSIFITEAFIALIMQQLTLMAIEQVTSRQTENIT